MSSRFFITYWLSVMYFWSPLPFPNVRESQLAFWRPGIWPCWTATSLVGSFESPVSASNIRSTIFVVIRLVMLSIDFVSMSRPVRSVTSILMTALRTISSTMF